MARARRSRAFGNYAVRAIGHKDKAKWVVEIAKSATEAKNIAKRLAAMKLGTWAPTVCIFDLKRWGRKPVCISRGNVKSKYSRVKFRRVSYQPR